MVWMTTVTDAVMMGRLRIAESPLGAPMGQTDMLTPMMFGHLLKMVSELSPVSTSFSTRIPVRACDLCICAESQTEAIC